MDLTIFYLLFVYCSVVIQFCFADFCSKNDCTPKTYQVTLSKNANSQLPDSYFETEETNRCWQYTWRGPVNERTNTTGQGCSNEANQKYVPCFEPIVWTNGTNKHNQPNLDDLKEKCENGDTLDNKICSPFCVKNEDVCIKMTYFNRDKERTIHKTVSFCGKGQMTTNDNQLIKNGCYSQENTEDGLDVEACFCNEPECNSTVKMHASHYKTLIFLLLLLVYAIR